MHICGSHVEYREARLERVNCSPHDDNQRNIAMNWFMVVVVDVQQLNCREKETHHVGRSSADKALQWLLLLLPWVYLFISHQKTRSMCDHTIFVPSLWLGCAGTIKGTTQPLCKLVPKYLRRALGWDSRSRHAIRWTRADSVNQSALTISTSSSSSPHIIIVWTGIE